jgi:uncharacterized protein YpmS
MGTIFALLLLILGIVSYFITGQAPIAAWGNTWLMPTNESAASLDEKIDRLKLEIDEAASGELLYLTITEEEVTSKLNCLCRDGNISFKMNYPQVYFNEGVVKAYADIDVVIDIQVAFEVTLTVEDGKLDVTCKNLHLGKIPIPKTLVNTVITALERKLEERLEEFTVTLKDITIRDGAMTVTLGKK